MVRPTTRLSFWQRLTARGPLLVLAAMIVLIAGAGGESLAQNMLAFPPRPKPPVRTERAGVLPVGVSPAGPMIAIASSLARWWYSLQ